MSMRGFGSDNHAPVHPLIMKALIDVNVGHAPSYGTDALTNKAIQLIKETCGPCEAFFVFNGTAANVTALQALTRPYHSILCSDISHINNDECGAPEFHTHCKLIPVPSEHGKIRLENLESFYIRLGDQHHSQPKVITLTQPTEVGTLYSIKEIKKIIHWAKSKKLYVHIDGARFATAAAVLNKTFHQLSSDLGVDVLSFGGTKNGLMFGEAVIFFNLELANNFKYIRKQSLQLPSKTRYIAAQFVEYFSNDLWKKIALHSHEMALFLYENIKDIDHVIVTHPVQSNSVFAKIPQTWVKALRKDHFFYVWNEASFECRFVCSWDTQKEDILSFRESLLKQTLSKVAENEINSIKS